MYIKLRYVFLVIVAVTAVYNFRAYFQLKTVYNVSRINGDGSQEIWWSSDRAEWEVNMQRQSEAEGAKAAMTKEPVMLLILTYARCGSSFFGNIFNSNPQAFYAYEPLDGVYVHLYGTQVGWNIGSDISHFPNMTRRSVDVEIDGMTDTLRQILTCNIEDLWPEVAMHDFWRYFMEYADLRPFQNCLIKNKISIANCHEHILDKCGKRFDPRKSPGKCFNPLASESQSIQHLHYYVCIRNQIPAASSCLKHLESACMDSTIRSVKTVRTNMKVAERLLQELPNLKVLHLMRDPRAVALSRGDHPSYHSLHSYRLNNRTSHITYDLVKEAAIVCDSFTFDLEKRKQLGKRFPGRIMEVIYEQFVNSPINATQEIYNFLEGNPPTGTDKTEAREVVMSALKEWDETTLDGNVVTWLKNNTGQSKDIAEKWKTRQRKSVWELVYEHPLCKSLFEQYGHVWPSL